MYKIKPCSVFKVTVASQTSNSGPLRTCEVANPHEVSLVARGVRTKSTYKVSVVSVSAAVYLYIVKDGILLSRCAVPQNGLVSHIRSISTSLLLSTEH